MTKKIAVVLFNLGGPDRPEAVKPFLFNLFNDKNIIGAPGLIRYMIATLISTRRAPVAREIYKHLGGKSPLLELTLAQAQKLEDQLNGLDPLKADQSAEETALAGEQKPAEREQQASTGAIYRAFPCMRYWHPMADEVVKQVKDWQADEVILLPLYPQFSTTTTGSSLEDWRRASRKYKLRAPTAAVGCYPFQPDFIEAHAVLLRDAYNKATAKGKPRILFSAHGLPKKVVEGGDPYQWQIEQTAAAIMERFCEKNGIDKPSKEQEASTERASPSVGEAVRPIAQASRPERGQSNNIDYKVCYQSKVGPLEWLKPSTEEEIDRACEEGVPIVILPIAFVSEHSETLVELDIEYKQLAEQKGCVGYERVPALGTNPHYIDALAKLCRNVEMGKLSSNEQKRLCPAEFGKCVCG